MSSTAAQQQHETQIRQGLGDRYYYVTRAGHIEARSRVVSHGQFADAEMMHDHYETHGELHAHEWAQRGHSEYCIQCGYTKAPQPSTPTPPARSQRSRELAIQHGLHVYSRAATTIGVGFDATTGVVTLAAWRVTSATFDDLHYIVTFHAETGVCDCECLAAQHGQACWHAGLGLLIADELVQLYPPRDVAADARRDAAHEGNAWALGFSH